QPPLYKVASCPFSITDIETVSFSNHLGLYQVEAAYHELTEFAICRMRYMRTLLSHYKKTSGDWSIQSHVCEVSQT
ncbi:MAG: hypothetical protein ACK53Y_26415, partial [bacterium]